MTRRARANGREDVLLETDATMMVANDAALTGDLGEALRLYTQTPTRRIATAYRIVTPESAEDGDVAEHGWQNEEGDEIEIDEDDIEEQLEGDISTHPVSDAVVAKAARWFGTKSFRQGMEASSSHYDPHVWYSGPSDTDYSTGAETTHDYFLRFFTDYEKRWIFAEVTGKRSHLMPSFHANPSRDLAAQAIDKYREFHRYDPKHVGAMPQLRIPATLRLAGDAKHVLYRSAKTDPETLRRPRKPIDYIHEHDAGVRTYLPGRGSEVVPVPEAFRKATALALLGSCLGYAFTERGELVEAVGKAPLPELYCTPDGKCLIVIQGKRDVLAMMWGGGLGVFARGIDG